MILFYHICCSANSYCTHLKGLPSDCAHLGHKPQCAAVTAQMHLVGGQAKYSTRPEAAAVSVGNHLDTWGGGGGHMGGHMGGKEARVRPQSSGHAKETGGGGLRLVVV